MNGVIQISTGDLLRAGFTSFAGQFDAATEQERTDIPQPARVRGRRDTGETFHRWNGTAWVMVTQPTSSCSEFIVSSKISSAEEAVVAVSTWQDLGHPVASTPDSLVPDLAQAKGRASGYYKMTGAGGKLAIFQNDDANPMGSLVLADTAGAWMAFGFTTSTAPTAGTHLYSIRGRLDGATLLSVKAISLTLFRVWTY